MYVVHYEQGNISGYVKKHDGMNDFVKDPRQASKYFTPEEARESGLVGHHYDMGGSGFKGRVVGLKAATDNYISMEERE